MAKGMLTPGGRSRDEIVDTNTKPRHIRRDKTHVKRERDSRSLHEPWVNKESICLDSPVLLVNNDSPAWRGWMTNPNLGDYDDPDLEIYLEDEPAQEIGGGNLIRESDLPGIFNGWGYRII